MARDDERVAEENDEFEVYERKEPRPEAKAGRRGREEPPEDSLASSFGRIPPRPPAPERRDDDDTAADAMPDDVTDDATGSEAASLPPPPAEPMRPRREEAPTGLARWSGAGEATPARTGRVEAAPPTPPAPSFSPSPPSPSRLDTRGVTMRIAIAATEFNYDIVNMMVERARSHAEFLGANVAHLVRVPGTYDLPFAVQRLVRRDDVDGVVTLGCVIEGETDHDDLVIQHAARKIIDLSLQHDKPVGLGITGPGMSRLQAEARIDRAKDAVEAVVKLHRTLTPL